MKRSVVAITALAALGILAVQSSVAAQTNPSPSGTLNNQKTELSLQFPGDPSAKATLNATEVEKTIEMLAQMRAAMNPSRPMIDPATGTKINIATAGRWYVQPDGNGIDLIVLHPGYGWVGIYMDRGSIEELDHTLYRSVHPVTAKVRHLKRG